MPCLAQYREDFVCGAATEFGRFLFQFGREGGHEAVSGGEQFGGARVGAEAFAEEEVKVVAADGKTPRRPGLGFLEALRVIAEGGGSRREEPAGPGR